MSRRCRHLRRRPVFGPSTTCRCRRITGVSSGDEPDDRRRGVHKVPKDDDPDTIPTRAGRRTLRSSSTTVDTVASIRMKSVEFPNPLRLRHFLLALAVVAIWGTNFVVIRNALDHFPPLLFAALRYGFAFLPAALFLPRPAVPWR